MRNMNNLNKKENVEDAIKDLAKIGREAGFDRYTIPELRAATLEEAYKEIDEELEERKKLRCSKVECPRCSFVMLSKHCKIVCRNCGAKYDCSDIV